MNGKIKDMKSGAVGRSVFDFIYDGVAMALFIILIPKPEINSYFSLNIYLFLSQMHFT